ERAWRSSSRTRSQAFRPRRRRASPARPSLTATRSPRSSGRAPTSSCPRSRRSPTSSFATPSAGFMAERAPLVLALAVIAGSACARNEHARAEPERRPGAPPVRGEPTEREERVFAPHPSQLGEGELAYRRLGRGAMRGLTIGPIESALHPDRG